MKGQSLVFFEGEVAIQSRRVWCLAIASWPMPVLIRDVPLRHMIVLYVTASQW